MPIEREQSFQEQQPEKAKREQLMTEEEYISLCVGYALSTGWVKEEQKDFLVEKILRPIYAEAVRVIEEAKPLIEEDPTFSPEQDTKIMIQKINSALDSTRRIGSTDVNNVLRGVKDCSHTSAYWVRAAIDTLYDKISDLLWQYVR